MYRLGGKSLRELEGVRPQLVAVVAYAITLTTVDFAVHDGIRTKEEQRANVAKGVSKTMNSKHLWGGAVDLVPYVNGKLEFNDWDPLFEIADAMRTSARTLAVPIIWGGTWRRLDNTTLPPKQLREVNQGWDGFHFELINHE